MTTTPVAKIPAPRYPTPTGEPCPYLVRADGTVEGDGACRGCGSCLLGAGWEEK